MDRPTFTLVVVGTATKPTTVEAKLYELLRLKLKTHDVRLHVTGPFRGPAVGFAAWYSLPVVYVKDPDPREPNGATRNTELLRLGDGFLAFGPEAGLSPADADLLYRARNSGRGSRVRVVEVS
jgi:hypothetical protein